MIAGYFYCQKQVRSAVSRSLTIPDRTKAGAAPHETIFFLHNRTILDSLLPIIPLSREIAIELPDNLC